VAIYHAGGAEGWFEIGNNNADTCWSSNAGYVTARGSSSGDDGTYCWECLINANGELASVTPTQTSTSGVTLGAATEYYLNFRFKLPASAIAPAAAWKMVIIDATPWELCINTSGEFDLREANTTRDTWAAGLSADTWYWGLLYVNSSTDTISFWAGQEHASETGLLDDPADWSGAAQLTYTSASSLTITSNVRVGAQNFSKANANFAAAAFFDSYVLMDTKPTQPVIPYLLTLDGDGNYSGGSTAWTKSGGGAATYTVVDDAVSATPDTSDYILSPTPTGSGGVQRVSFTMTSCASAGVESDATVHALIPFGWARRAAGSLSATGQHALSLRYSGTDLEGADVSAARPGTSYAVGNRSCAWQVFNTAPGGGAWDQTIVDATEMGLYQNDTSAVLDAVFEYAWLACYVVTERPTPSAFTPLVDRWTKGVGRGIGRGVN
jgi:hypothetical protein